MSSFWIIPGDKLTRYKFLEPIVSIEILAGEKLQINGLIHRRCVGFKLSNSTETFSYTWFDSQGRAISNTDTIQVPINDPTVFGSYECHFIAGKSQKTFITQVNIKGLSLEKCHYSIIDSFSSRQIRPTISLISYHNHSLSAKISSE